MKKYLTNCKQNAEFEVEFNKHCLTENLEDAKSIISDQIRGEWEAIQNYNKAIDDLNNTDGSFESVMDLLSDIADEEEQHVGELTRALSDIDDNVLEKISDGQDEAEEKLSGDMQNESLTEEVNTPLITKVLDYINDIYELRKAGIAEGGEYSIPNLVFKEIRNKGYLDNLKELKNKLVGKELSLESLQEGIITTVNEVLKDTSKMEILVSILNKVTGKDYSYLLEKVPTKEGKSAVPMYIVHNYNSNHDDNILDNLFIVNKKDHEKYINGKISFDDVEKIDLGKIFSGIVSDDSLKEDTVKQKGKWVNKGKAGTHGEFKTKKEANAQRRAMFANGFTENLDLKTLYKYRNELSRISHNRAVVQENGLFNIYNVKEDDVFTIVNRIRNLKYIEWVNKTTGKYDFTKPAMFGQLQPRYYNITGKIKD